MCDRWCVYRYDALHFNHKVTPCRNVTSNQHVVQKQHVSCTASTAQSLLGLWEPHGEKKKSTLFLALQKEMTKNEKYTLHCTLHPCTSRALHFYFYFFMDTILESWNYMLQNFGWAVRQFERQHYILRCFYVVGVALPLDFWFPKCSHVNIYLSICLFIYLFIVRWTAFLFQTYLSTSKKKTQKNLTK